MRGAVLFQALLLPRLLHRAHSRSSRPWNHRAAVAHADAALSDALTYTPVGLFEGPFRRRNGTPRQGSLAPRARGTVRLLDDVLAGGASAALEGLAGFSHCVLLFAFHENQASRAAAKGALCTVLFTSLTPSLAVAPPRLGGERFGVFATRSPHRPNPVGLSVVRVEGVESSCLHVSGCDLLDGTPVLDIKPYIPAYDAHPDATVPAWLAAAPDTSPHEVLFSDAATAGLAAAAPWLRYCLDAADARGAVEDALRSELRSSYRRASASAASDVYAFYFDCLDVRCVFDDAQRRVTVLEVAHSPQGEGVSSADARTFGALLSSEGLPARVSDQGMVLWRANGVLLGVPVGSQHAGCPATLRYDWRARQLRVTLPGAHQPRVTLDVDQLAGSTQRGYKTLRAAALFCLKGPVPGGSGGWLRAGQKLGVAALWDALHARAELTGEQLERLEARGEEHTHIDE
jgi:tRNA-Thr(GGU) m(6)t(6)A37 methyltransferase TsaA